MELTRRNFLKGASAVAGAAALAGIAAGCAPSSGDSKNEGEEKKDAIAAPTADAEIECDVVICGAGISGLSAACQAADEGLKAIVLEKMPDVGGNGSGVEGVFGYNTSAQIEQGLSFDPGALVRHEVNFSQNRPNGAKIRDLVYASADNYEWMKDHGVQFSGLVNDYGGLYPTMHWFEGGKASVGYVPAMHEFAEKAGVEFRLETSAIALNVDGGKVNGVYAEDSDGKVTLFKARGVILATGGFGGNADMVQQMGWPLAHMGFIGAPGHDGDGISMAIEAGARSMVEEACQLCGTGVEGLPPTSPTTTAICFGGPFLWVDAAGERVINEDFAADNMMNIAIPLQSYRELWAVASQGIIDAAIAGNTNAASKDTGTDPREELSAAVESCPSNNIFKAGSVEELAKAAKIDAVVLKETVERYNELCAAGSDADFGKDASMMVPIEGDELYIYRLDPSIMVAIGGLDTDKYMRVLDEQYQPIEGLYAAGVDGNNLYRHVYPINVGATCCGNNVNSGRVAVRHIVQNL